MSWRTNGGVLIAHGRTFLLVNEAGTVVREFGTRTVSDEDDLYIWDHRVEEGVLYACARVERYRGETRCDKTALMGGLVLADDPATHALAESVRLRRIREKEEGLVRAEARGAAREQSQAAERQAKLAGAPKGYLFGEDVAPAQRALASRVRLYGDQRAAELLSTLFDLMSAHVDSLALTFYARGCRQACFELDLPTTPAAADVSTATVQRREDFAERLDAHALALLTLADGQEAVDANANARCYRRAAQEISRAAKRLG